MFFSWEGDRRPGEKLWQPTAGDDLSHVRADCLYTWSWSLGTIVLVLWVDVLLTTVKSGDSARVIFS